MSLKETCGKICYGIGNQNIRLVVLLYHGSCGHYLGVDRVHITWPK